MTYSVKEIFYTLQGEGAHTGKPSVFCRFTGCNLWNGLERDRDAAICRFCDTDFVGTDGQGGGKFETSDQLADAVAECWPVASSAEKFVVCTGGEPLLQLDDGLVAALQERGFYVAVETNGTLLPPTNLDWICVSPKGGAGLSLKHGNELKFVFPQEELGPESFSGLEFDHFWLQPMDGPDQGSNTKDAIAYCLEHPTWKLSIQTHKVIGID